MSTHIVMPSDKVAAACDRAIKALDDAYEEDEAKAIDEFADYYKNRWFRRLWYALTGKRTVLSFEEAKAMYNKVSHSFYCGNDWYWRQIETSGYKVHADWYRRLRSMSRQVDEVHLDQDTFNRLERYL